jgi:hypothetical protein
MPNNLPLAVEIADIAAHAPPANDHDVMSTAADLEDRHPEADVSLEEIAQVLREETGDAAAS